MFRYYTGEEVMVGDRVITGNKKPGVVEKVIEPESEDSENWDCPDGGVLIEEDWSGQKGLLLMTPDVGEWEDLVFLERAK